MKTLMDRTANVTIDGAFDCSSATSILDAVDSCELIAEPAINPANIDTGERLTPAAQTRY